MFFVSGKPVLGFHLFLNWPLVGGNIKTYWAEFTKPEMQEKYADVENLSEVVKKMTRLTLKYLQQYRHMRD